MNQVVENHVVEPDATRAAPRHTDAHPAVVTSDSARQGPRGTRVLYVLLIGLTLGLVLLGVVYVGWLNVTPA